MLIKKSYDAVVGAAFNINSYRNVLSDICSVNDLSCRFVFMDGLPVSSAVNYDLVIGNVKDIVSFNIKSRIYYIVVEGYLQKLQAHMLKLRCKDRYCISVTKWGKSILEQYDIPVHDVVYHGLPVTNLPDPNDYDKRVHDVIYLNASYNLLTTNFRRIDRKGWQFWPDVYNAFPNSKGYTNSKLSLPGVETYKSKTIDEIYAILNSGKVFANLSLSEGFGINPLMALAVGTNVVFWDLPVFRELYQGVRGAYFVPVNNTFNCLFPDNIMYSILCSHGDVLDYILMVRYTLSNWSLADYQTIRQRFNPHTVYRSFGELIRRR